MTLRLAACLALLLPACASSAPKVCARGIPATRHWWLTDLEDGGASRPLIATAPIELWAELTLRGVSFRFPRSWEVTGPDGRHADTWRTGSGSPVDCHVGVMKLSDYGFPPPTRDLMHPGFATHRVNGVPLVILEFEMPGTRTKMSAVRFDATDLDVTLICRGALAEMPDDFFIPLATACWPPPTSASP